MMLLLIIIIDNILTAFIIITRIMIIISMFCRLATFLLRIKQQLLACKTSQKTAYAAYPALAQTPSSLAKREYFWPIKYYVGKCRCHRPLSHRSLPTTLSFIYV